MNFLSKTFYLIVICLSLSAGNFFYQYLNNQEWNVAAERSFFQFIALLAVCLYELIFKYKQD